MVGSNDGAFRLAPCVLGKRPGWFLVAVNTCAAIGANGGCGSLVEGDGCGRDVGGMNVGAVVKLNGYLIVV